MGLFRPKTKCGNRWITRRREIERQLVQKFRSLVIHSAWLDRAAMAPESGQESRGTASDVAALTCGCLSILCRGPSLLCGCCLSLPVFGTVISPRSNAATATYSQRTSAHLFKAHVENMRCCFKKQKQSHPIP